MTEVDHAAEHAYELLRQHVQLYRTAIHCEPHAWRTRCKELAENLDWILFCRDHRLPPDTKKTPYPPMPPRLP
ncbi:hypothetical protein RPMA_09560 [Tardiphaga alba]|uniref:Uncharacterized protein n=1 Tax=Tardiphaga alba TaxID=340268 RepID=A0ABX8A6X0_9BRAD|nr:hypothetical protein [Tardiphaga alba]QUS39051.1 hypothetical protein RPMA_09560 [Tardiphaga alba]